VMDLYAGDNDVSQLAPGVYFVYSSIASRQSSGTMVVIAR